MSKRTKVIVAGAGAAGLMAAIAAAREGAEVTVLEAMEKPGKKLLLTGNGRCNLTNLDEHLYERYYGSGSEIAKALTRNFDGAAVCQFFEELGLLTQEKNGYVYPYSAQSSSVLDVLLAEVRRLKIKLKLSEKIMSVHPTDPSDCTDDDFRPWTVETATWKYQGDSVVIACGSKCIPATGSDGSGYVLARKLGHRVLPVRPALTPLICKSEELAALQGVRCRARVSLFRNQKMLAADSGELQWTKYGVSGIVVFQLSRFVSNASNPEELHLEIDLLPEFEQKKLEILLRNRAVQIPNEKAAVLLSGMLNEKLIPVILKHADDLLKKETGSSGKKLRSLTRYSCSELEDKHLNRIIQGIKQFILPVTGTKEFDSCQVCSGGIDCRELNPGTLESIKQKGLFFAGEVVDVDGPCGGYNLQWAWSSGYAAGKAAAHLNDDYSHC